jgi:uncharacterized protein YacL
VLSKEEKRFIKYWEEQRTGGKIQYYLLYILAGTFIAVLVLWFLYSLVFSVVFSFRWPIISIIISSFVIVTILTVTSWSKNEKKFKSIIKREIREGQIQDDKSDDEKLV